MIYVLDTNALVFFLKDAPELGARARRILSDPRSRIVVPNYCFEELRLNLRNTGRQPMRVPPMPALRLLAMCRNVRVFPTGMGVQAEYSQLSDPFRRNEHVDRQDLPIVASAISIRKATGLEVTIVTRDGKRKRWPDVATVW